MSPILVRPVREQLEHDRVIRLLQAKYKRKFEVAINPGAEQAAPVGGPPPWYPDLVLQSTDKSHKLVGVVEVETTESVNHLEAMSQWGAFSRLRVPFHLYVPAGCVDSARRLCTDLQITVAEVWAYHAMGDQMRFTPVLKVPQPAEPKRPAAPVAAAAPAAAKPAAAPAGAKSAAAAKPPAAAVPRKPAAARARANGAAARPAARRAAAPAPASAARRKPAPATAKAKPAAGGRAASKTARKAAPARPARTQKRR